MCHRWKSAAFIVALILLMCYLATQIIAPKFINVGPKVAPKLGLSEYSGSAQLNAQGSTASVFSTDSLGCSHEQFLDCLADVTATTRIPDASSDEFESAYKDILDKMGAVLPQGGSCSAPPRPPKSCKKHEKCSTHPVLAKPCSSAAQKPLLQTCHCHVVKAWRHMQQPSSVARLRGKRVLFYGSGALAQIYEHFACAVKVLNLDVYTQLKSAQSDGQIKGRGGYTILESNSWDLVVASFGSHYNIEGTGISRKWPSRFATGMKTFLETIKTIASRKSSPPKLLWLEPPAQHFPYGTYTVAGHSQLVKSCEKLPTESWYNASWRVRITDPLLKPLGVHVLRLFNLSFQLWADHPFGVSKDCSNYCTIGPFLIHATTLLLVKLDLLFS